MNFIRSENHLALLHLFMLLGLSECMLWIQGMPRVTYGYQQLVISCIGLGLTIIVQVWLVLGRVQFLTPLGLNWALPQTNCTYTIMIQPKPIQPLTNQWIQSMHSESPSNINKCSNARWFSNLMKFTAVSESLSYQSNNVLFQRKINWITNFCPREFAVHGSVAVNIVSWESTVSLKDTDIEYLHKQLEKPWPFRGVKLWM